MFFLLSVVQMIGLSFLLSFCVQLSNRELVQKEPQNQSATLQSFIFARSASDGN